MVDPDVYLFVDCFVLLCCFVPAKKKTRLLIANNG